MPWDSPLSALADIVTACGELDDDPWSSGPAGMRISKLVVDTPLELRVDPADDGVVALAAAPPRQAAATSVMPVLHRIRLHVEVA
jgi:hypothetical protein